MMEHLHTRIFFINEKLYTTSSGIVASDIKELLSQLAFKAENKIVNILCDDLPVYDVINFLPHYTVEYLLTNATFTYRPIPVEMIEPNIILLCKAHYTDNTEKIHQIAFYYNNICYRFGVPV